jgi:hypothetical protein
MPFATVNVGFPVTARGSVRVVDKHASTVWMLAGL